MQFKMQVKPSAGLYYCYRCEAGGRTDLSWLPQIEDTVARSPVVASMGPPEGFEPLDISARVHGPYVEYLRSRQVLDAALSARAGVCR